MAWQNALGSTGLGFATNLVQSLQQRDMNLIGTQMASIMEMASAMNPMVRDLEMQAQLAMLQQGDAGMWPNFGMGAEGWGNQALGTNMIASSRASYNTGSRSSNNPVVSFSNSLHALFAGFLGGGSSSPTTRKTGSLLDQMSSGGGGGSSFVANQPFNPPINASNLPKAVIPPARANGQLNPAPVDVIPVMTPQRGQSQPVKTITVTVTQPTPTPKPVNVIRYLDGSSHTLMSNGKIYEKDEYGNVDTSATIDTRTVQVSYDDFGRIAKMVKTNEDGTVVTAYANGLREESKNGEVKLVKGSAYNSQVLLTSAAGDTLVRNSNGQIVYNQNYNDDTATTTLTYLDGAKEVKQPDGEIRLYAAAGRLQYNPLKINPDKDKVLRSALSELLSVSKRDDAAQTTTTYFRNGEFEVLKDTGVIKLYDEYGYYQREVNTQGAQLKRDATGKLLSVTTNNNGQKSVWFNDNVGSTETQGTDGILKLNYGGNVWQIDTQKATLARGDKGKVLYFETVNAETNITTRTFTDSNHTIEVLYADGRMTVTSRQTAEKTIETAGKTLIRDAEGKLVGTTDKPPTAPVQTNVSITTPNVVTTTNPPAAAAALTTADVTTENATTTLAKPPATETTQPKATATTTADTQQAKPETETPKAGT